MARNFLITLGVILLIVVVTLLFRGDSFDLPEGETISLGDETTEEVSGAESGNTENSQSAGTDGSQNQENLDTSSDNSSITTNNSKSVPRTSKRETFETDGVKHSIPLSEILSGGPPKDGIPSIDNPKFISTKEADEFLTGDAIGLGVTIAGESRFYPYQILVWHEIVNDSLSGEPILVTYCPLCATGVVFERRVRGEVQEFGVSGMLWKSNLLMYNRASSESEESLWSQVLGEAVLGPNTGEKLKIVASDTVKYSDWKKAHPKSQVLSRDTGSIRTYGRDPYGDYYTNESVSFGASFNDDRLHPKAFVFGVEVNGKFKAYHNDALKVGLTRDTFNGKPIDIEKSASGEVRMSIDGSDLPYIGGFWFSWLAVHPETELFQ